MADIGPGLLSFLMACIPAAVGVATLWLQAKKAAEKRDDQLREIHVAVNSNMTKALQEIESLKEVVSNMLKTQSPAEQATADQAGQDSLKR
jgi:hypothetical protein